MMRICDQVFLLLSNAMSIQSIGTEKLENEKTTKCKSSNFKGNVVLRTIQMLFTKKKKTKPNPKYDKIRSFLHVNEEKNR